MSKFWRYFAASGVLLAMTDGGAMADPPKPQLPPPGGLQPAGGQPVLQNPPRLNVAKSSLSNVAKLGFIKSNFKLEIKPENLDEPVHVDARNPWVKNGMFTIGATGVGQYYPSGAAELGPYIDLLPYGTIGSYHPHFSLGFAIAADRGALIDCTMGGSGGPWKQYVEVQGSSQQVTPVDNFPDGHLTVFIQKASIQRTGGLMLRVEGNNGFAVTGCDITPVRY